MLSSVVSQHHVSTLSSHLTRWDYLKFSKTITLFSHLLNLQLSSTSLESEVSVLVLLLFQSYLKPTGKAVVQVFCCPILEEVCNPPHIQKTLHRVAVPGSQLRGKKNLPQKFQFSLRKPGIPNSRTNFREPSSCFNPQDRYQIFTAGFYFDRSRVICKSYTLMAHEN